MSNPTEAWPIDARRLIQLAVRLVNASDPFLADQGKAADSRCGIVQPVEVEHCNELIRANEEMSLFLESLDVEL